MNRGITITLGSDHRTSAAAAAARDLADVALSGTDIETRVLPVETCMRALAHAGAGCVDQSGRHVPMELKNTKEDIKAFRETVEWALTTVGGIDSINAAVLSELDRDEC